ncbi:DUF3592 domain-containing protein [Halorientalis regularis]|uniref:DUF3592 domain-containing protein n=1 Tax=Halorientalis regularis TaxID=660518 RepID=A0A1G7FPU4_9EURY|nr:DUF3592 domain-containing protein [Halorientalis regularis]SDE77828.1 Protein of unknown function [Halorientalis regularis]
MKGGIALAILGFAMLAASVGGIVPAVTGASGHDRVQATVVETGIEEFDDDEEYRPVVVYEYEIDGETYRSDNFYPGSTYPPYTEAKARDRISGYESGETVTMFVDLDDPDRAFLERQPLGERIVSLGGYAVGILIGAPLLVGGGKLTVSGLRSTGE